MDDIKTFVALKYQLITDDRDTWHLFKSYPLEVISTWVWRCAADTEHLVCGHKEAEKCLEAAKKYRDGLTTWGDLIDAADSNSTCATTAAYAAARAAFYAASADAGNYDLAAYAAFYAAYAAYYAANYAAYATTSAEVHSDNWQLYISWLVEELCEWELTHG